jgi:beta-lactamase class D
MTPAASTTGTALRKGRPVRATIGIAALLLGPSLLSGCTAYPAQRVDPNFAAEAKGCAALVDSARSTFVLHEVRTGRTLVCNASRASQRFTPASTFKIPHALIALESGVVTDENARFVWDVRPRGVSAWDKDTSLAEAIAPSTVWVFQTIARRLGHAREAEAVRRLDYGNLDVGEPRNLPHFWLSGPLAISASEQVRFLTRLRAGALDAGRRNQLRTVAMLRVRNCGPNCIVYGKTGAMLPIDDEGFLRQGESSLLPPDRERTGWFVGWVERPVNAGGPVIFAHNLDLTLPHSMAARTNVAYEILGANGVSVGEVP